MSARKKEADVARSQLTPTILIVGAITLAGWLWFYFHGLPLDAAATIVLAVAALLLVLLVRAVPYARIFRAVTVKGKRDDAKRRQPRVHQR